MKAWQNIILIFIILLSAKAQSQTVRKCDRVFMEKVALCNIYQMQLAKVYETKGNDADLKSFAQFSIAENLNAASELKSLAGKKGVVLPQMLRKSQSHCVNKLSEMDGNELSKKYQRLAQKNLRQLERTYRRAVSKTKDEEIAAFAANALNSLEKQLNKLKAEQDSIAAHNNK